MGEEPSGVSGGGEEVAGNGTEAGRVHVWVEGRVQGVGFRAHAEWKARSIGVRGWVRNVSEDVVEAVAEGDRRQLDLFVEAMRVGPTGARVLDTRVEWAPSTGEFTGFSVRRSA